MRIFADHCVPTDIIAVLRELGWHARLTIEDMCRDAWRWQTANPAGYP